MTERLNTVIHCVPGPHLFIHLFTSRHLGCFHFLTIVNNATMDVGVQNNFETLLSVLCCIYPEVELLDFMLILFNFLRSCHTLFHSGCTI